jgi:DnaJ-class molecular chaperone
LYYIFQALCGGPLKITTVDGRKLMLQLKNVTTPNTETRIKGEGLVETKTSRRGDLILAFDIIFPIKLSPSTKEQFSKLLA